MMVIICPMKRVSTRAHLPAGSAVVRPVVISHPYHVSVDNYIEEVRQKYGFDQERALGMLMYHRFDVTEAPRTIATYTKDTSDCWSVQDDLTFRLEMIYQNHYLIGNPKKKPKSGRSSLNSAPFPLLTRLKQVCTNIVIL